MAIQLLNKIAPILGAFSQNKKEAIKIASLKDLKPLDLILESV